MKHNITYYAFVVALAGFLFGFDMVVISGADLALQTLWPRGDFFHGFVIMSSALWGTVIGAMFGNYPTNAWGRKKTLIAIGLLYFVSAVGSALAQGPWEFAIFRWIGGLAVGASTIAAPAYISEIAPAEKRGRLVALYQFNIVFGILIAYLSNFLLRDEGTYAWRWMLGVEAFPALLYSLLVLAIPESPRWLATIRHNTAAAKQVLLRYLSEQQAVSELARITAPATTTTSRDSIFSAQWRGPLMLAFLLAFFNQFSGINAFLYYAPRIFETAGLQKSEALLSSAGIGVVNLCFTFIGIYLIDRLGRRQLMYIGTIGYIISLTMIAITFAAGWKGIAVPGWLFLFIAAHAIGQGTVIWVYIAEIFPNHLRAGGQAFGSSVHWILAAIIPALMPVSIRAVGISTVFGFFAFMMVLQFFFVWKMMRETKGIALEDVESNFTK